MKRLLLIVIILVLAGFGWLAAMEHPAPVRSYQDSVPASVIMGE